MVPAGSDVLKIEDRPAARRPIQGGRQWIVVKTALVPAGPRR
jgi:hypothetical protein